MDATTLTGTVFPLEDIQDDRQVQVLAANVVRLGNEVLPDELHLTDFARNTLDRVESGEVLDADDHNDLIDAAIWAESTMNANQVFGPGRAAHLDPDGWKVDEDDGLPFLL
jgi:hypothetical protein